MVLTLIGIITYVLNGIAFYRLAKIAGLQDLAWFAWIPILSTILRLRMIQKSGWWILILLIPVVNFIFTILWNIRLLRAFGKHGAFVLFMVFLNPIYTILWIVWGLSDDTQYLLNRNNPGYSYGHWGA